MVENATNVKVFDDGKTEKISDAQIKALDKLSKSDLQNQTLAELSKVRGKVQDKVDSYMKRSKNEKSKKWIKGMFDKVSAKLDSFKNKISGATTEGGEGGEAPKGGEGGEAPKYGEGGETPKGGEGEESETGEQSSEDGGWEHNEGEGNLSEKRKKSVEDGIRELNYPKNGANSKMSYAELFKGNEELARLLMKDSNPDMNITHPTISNYEINGDTLSFYLVPYGTVNKNPNNFQFKLPLESIILENGKFSEGIFVYTLNKEISKNKDELRSIRGASSDKSK